MESSLAVSTIQTGPAQCVTQKDCQELASRLLEMQKACREIQASATEQHLLSIRKCYQQTLQKLQCYRDKSKCWRCTSLKIRWKIQNVEQDLMRYIASFNKWLAWHETHSHGIGASVHQRDRRIEGQIENMQHLKSPLVYAVIHCRKGQSFVSELQEQVKEVSQAKVWLNFYREIQQHEDKVNNYEDADDRTAPVREECPTFIHLPNILNHINALYSYHQDAPKPLTVHDRSSILEDLQKVAGMLNLVFEGAKCKRCRNYNYQEAKGSVNRALQVLKQAIDINNDRLTGRYLELNILTGVVRSYSCLNKDEEPDETEKLTWQQIYEDKLEPVNVEVVPVEQCSTRKEGAVLFDRLQQILNTWNELKSTTTILKLHSVVKSELQDALKLWQQYVKMPKCKSCHSERSRAERELLRWNCQRMKEENTFSDMEDYGRLVVGPSLTLFLAQVISKAMGLCQKE